MLNGIQPASIGRIQHTPQVTTARSAQTTTGIPGGAPVEGTPQATFKEMLLDSIRQANVLRQDADQAVASLGSQHAAGPAEVLGAVEQTDLAFRTMLEVHNKLVQAYQEIQHIVD